MKNTAILTVSGDGFELTERVFPVCMHPSGLPVPVGIEIAGYGWTSLSKLILPLVGNCLPSH